MRTIIAGSRTTNTHDVLRAMDTCPWRPTAVISGTARGGDQAGEIWARLNGVPIERFPVDWETHGRGAGHIRNKQMAETAEALVLVWDGQSPGSANMRDTARARNLRIHEVIV